MTVSLRDQARIEAAIFAALGDTGTGASFGLATATAMAGAAEAEARAMALPIVFAATDRDGGLVLVHRMENALPASLDIAINKAFTAAAFRMPTHELGGQAQPGQPLYGVEATNKGRVVLFGGGYPVRRGGLVVGAIGVSGGTVDQDMKIATHALRAFEERDGAQL